MTPPGVVALTYFEAEKVVKEWKNEGKIPTFPRVEDTTCLQGV